MASRIVGCLLFTLLALGCYQLNGQIVSQYMSQGVYTYADAEFDVGSSVFDHDYSASAQNGFFGEDQTATSVTTTGKTNAKSSVSGFLSSSLFLCSAELGTNAIEAGASENACSMYVEFDFEFPNGGLFDMEVSGVSAVRPDDIPGDGRSDRAFVNVEIIDELGIVFLNEWVHLAPRDEESLFLEGPRAFDLPAGNYTFSISAGARGSNENNNFDGQARGSLISLLVSGIVVPFPSNEMVR